MVLVAVAGCALIACVFFYNWYAEKRIYYSNNKPRGGKLHASTEDTQLETRPEKSRQATNAVVTVTIPATQDSPDRDNPTLPKVEVSIPTIVQAETDVDSTPRMSLPMASAAQNNTAPSSSMPPPPRSRSPPRLKPPTFSSAPPRPGGILRPPPSAASSLRVPVTKVLPNTSMAPSSLMPPPQKTSRAVALEPGHSPLDWAALTSNPSNNLRGKDAPTTFVRVTPSQLKAQNGRKGKDTWTVYQGKVYNLTPYVPFHPGGKGEILRGAGKDSAKLFNEVHPWVNWDGMLKECMVGIYVSEDEMRTENELDEMD